LPEKVIFLYHPLISPPQVCPAAFLFNLPHSLSFQAAQQRHRARRVEILFAIRKDFSVATPANTAGASRSLEMTQEER
jgi:hypothetical protein